MDKKWKKTGAFLEQNAAHPGDECLIWPYGRDGGGYARAKVSGYTTRLAHRIMCEMAHGKPPFLGAVARHECGNGHLGCVNPRHLKWGTVAENNADKEIHGTKPIGHRIARSILCPDAVRDIRQRQAAGMTQKQIAAVHNVHPTTVQAVIEGRTWRHVQ